MGMSLDMSLSLGSGGGGPLAPNLLTASQAFDNAAWVKSGMSISANSANAPDGTATADSYVESALTETHQMYQAVTLTATTYTFELRVKPVGRTWVCLRLDTGGGQFAFFDLSGAGAVGTVDAAYTSSSISAIADGYYLCSVTRLGTAAGYFAVIHPSTNGSAVNYAGSGANAFYIWGADAHRGAPRTYVAT